MGGYNPTYIDIETTGLRPSEGAVVVQVQLVPRRHGRWGMPSEIHCYHDPGDLDQDKERAALEVLRGMGYFMQDGDPWRFIPIGWNVGFEAQFLAQRALALGVIDKPYGPESEYWTRPCFDLQPVVVLANGERYKGSRMQDWTMKGASGDVALAATKRRDWPALRRYTDDETKAFMDKYDEVCLILSEVIKPSAKPQPPTLADWAPGGAAGDSLAKPSLS